VGEQTLQSRRKWIEIAAGCAVFVAVGALLILNDNRFAGWLGVVCFGAFLVAAIANVLRPPRLQLTDIGFELRSLGRGRWYFWSKCSEFSVWTIRRNPMVVFDYSDVRDGRTARMNQRLSGANASLPDTFGMKAADLAEMLNEYRAQAIDPTR
jgi:hypothetical protein